MPALADRRDGCRRYQLPGIRRDPRRARRADRGRVSRRIVAVDGTAGSGKSTLARRLARSLGVAYINTGLMYRALAAASLQAAVEPGDAERLVDLARALRFRVVGTDPPELYVEGYGPTDLTTPAPVAGGGQQPPGAPR